MIREERSYLGTLKQMVVSIQPCRDDIHLQRIPSVVRPHVDLPVGLCIDIGEAWRVSEKQYIEVEEDDGALVLTCTDNDAVPSAVNHIGPCSATSAQVGSVAVEITGEGESLCPTTI